MENAIFVGLFLLGILLFLGTMGVNSFKIFLNFIIRCLSGIIFISLINCLVQNSAPQFIVKINEITVGISGILGIWGVFLLYALRYYFTIF